MTHSLTNDQEAAIDKFAKMKVGALFMKMGAGKTRTACEIINKKPVDKVVWMCPKSLVKQTEREVAKYLDKPFVVRWYEQLSSSDVRYMEVRDLIDDKTMLVADESLKIKNGRAKCSTRMSELSKRTEWKLILNGTPISRNVLDLYTQFDFLSPKIIGMDYLSFYDTFLEYDVDKPSIIYDQHNVDALTKLIEPYVYECDLSLDIKSHYLSINYEHSIETDEEYYYAKEEVFRRIGDESLYGIRDIDFFRIISELQQTYLKYPEHHNAFLATLEDYAITKGIVFVRYLFEQDIIEGDCPFPVYRYNGNMTEVQRDNTIASFEAAEEGLLVMTYGVGSNGLNLQFCNTIVFYSHQFDYALEDQAAHRVYRLGQAKDVSYYHIFAPTGLDQMIRRNLDRKENLNNEFKHELEKIKQEGRDGLKAWLNTM